jgi:hypothetical protein
MQLNLQALKSLQHLLQLEQHRQVNTVKATKASLSKLTKQGLEDFAKVNYGVDIDKRKKKEELVKDVLKLSKKV